MAPKKQIALRLSPELYNKLAAWAEDEFRSVNGQIEYLLVRCVKEREKGKGSYQAEPPNLAENSSSTEAPISPNPPPPTNNPAPSDPSSSLRNPDG